MYLQKSVNNYKLIVLNKHTHFKLQLNVSRKNEVSNKCPVFFKLQLYKINTSLNSPNLRMVTPQIAGYRETAFIR